MRPKSSRIFTRYLLADGTNAEVLTWLDDHSRYALSVTAHRRVTGPIVLARFRAAVTCYGTPASTLIDNGMVFTTRLSGGKDAGADPCGPRWSAARATSRDMILTSLMLGPLMSRSRSAACGRVPAETSLTWLAAPIRVDALSADADVRPQAR